MRGYRSGNENIYTYLFFFQYIYCVFWLNKIWLTPAHTAIHTWTYLDECVAVLLFFILINDLYDTKKLRNDTLKPCLLCLPKVEVISDLATNVSEINTIFYPSVFHTDMC